MKRFSFFFILDQTAEQAKEPEKLRIELEKCENKTIDTSACPYWGDWSEWTSCENKCGSVSISRQRQGCFSGSSCSRKFSFFQTSENLTTMLSFSIMSCNCEILVEFWNFTLLRISGADISLAGTRYSSVPQFFIWLVVSTHRNPNIFWLMPTPGVSLNMTCQNETVTYYDQTALFL